MIGLMFFSLSKGRNMMTAQVKANTSWILKAIIKRRDEVTQLQQDKFHMRKFYHAVKHQFQQVKWRNLIQGNSARSRVVFTLWQVYHSRLATKDIMVRFGFLRNIHCCFCMESEIMQHLLFLCLVSKHLQSFVFQWIEIPHRPGNWNDEVEWLLPLCRGKNSRAKILKCAIAETVYAVWHNKNKVSFGGDESKLIDGPTVVDTIVNRWWPISKLRQKISTLIMSQWCPFGLVSLVSRILEIASVVWFLVFNSVL